MNNTKYDTAPLGSRPEPTLPLDGYFWHQFSLFNQSFNDKPNNTMENTINKVVSAAMQLAANTPSHGEVVKIIEGLAKYYVGYQCARYEYTPDNEYGHYHTLTVEFSGRPYIMVQVADDLCSAIVMLNSRMLREFSKPDLDLSKPVQTNLERLDWPELSQTA